VKSKETILKKILIRSIAATMVAIMMLTLSAGCRRNNARDGFEAPEFVFVPEIIAFPDEIREIRDLVYANDRIFFTSVVYDFDEETYFHTVTSGIYTMDIDGSNLRALENYAPATSDVPDAMGGVEIRSIGADNDGNLWVFEQGHFSRYNVPDDFDSETQEIWDFHEDLGMVSELRKLDSTGAQLISVDLSGLGGNNGPNDWDSWFQINTFVIDYNGNIYVEASTSEGMKIHVLNNMGDLQFKLDVPNWGGQLIRMPDGTVALNGWTDDGNALTGVDFAAADWGESISLPDNVHGIFPGGGDFDLVFNSGIGLSGLDLETGEVVRLINWIDSDVMTDGLGNITMLPDGRVLCTNQSWSRTPPYSTFELLILSKTPYSELPERTTLTLATFQLDWRLHTAIVEFNRTSTTHRIHVFDYIEFSTHDDWTVGLTRLSSEIIAGRVPDIIAIQQGMPFRQYVARGLLVDLYPLIDSDPELSRNDFLEGAFRAAEMDGGLYQIFPSFTVNTLVGHPSVVGEGMGWNMDEFKAVLDANPQADMPMGQWLTKTSFLRTAIMLGMDEYVDWAAGNTYFDTGDFAQLLEFANTFPEELDFGDGDFARPVPLVMFEPEEDLIATGRQIMVMAEWFGSFHNMQMYRAMFGGDFVFKGFPSESRNGNTLNVQAGLAITTRCADKDGAWSFIRTLLSSDWQLENTWDFPVNKAAFDERAAEVMFWDESVSHTMGWNGYSVELTPMTQEELDQVMELINSAAGTSGWDEGLMNIIMEGAEDFFNGRHNAQAAARVIQSAASIYIAEQS